MIYGNLARTQNIVHHYTLSESQFARILSMSLLVGEEVKAGVMREFGMMKGC